MSSVVEREFFRSGLELDVRSDGRPRLGLRPLVVEQGVQAFASGSCRVRNGEATVVAVVAADVGEAVEGKEEGSVTFRVLSDGNAAFSPPEAKAIEMRLSGLLTALYAGDGFDRRQLFVGEERAFRLNVTVCIAKHGGNLASLASVAVKGALMATRLPTATLTTQRDEVFVTVDKNRLQAPLNAASAPLLVELSVCGNYYYADATVEEERHRDGALTMGFAATGSDAVLTDFVVCRAGGLHAANLRSLTLEAAAIADQVHATVQRVGLAE